jgi:predicted lysophospholipase L1 biosynthesis ABC-type transport system permease subunit
MEKELREMLNVRFGYKTWDELKEMQRKIRAQRQKQVYDAEERKQAFINGTAIIGLLLALVGIAGTIFYFVAKTKGMI